MGPRGLLGRQRQPRADSRHRRFPVSLAAAQPWQGDPAAPARRLCPRPRRGVTLGCSVLAQRAPAGPGLSGACFVKWGLPHTPRPYAHPPSRACEPPGTQQLPVTPPPSQPHRGAPASPERGWGSPQTCPAQPPPQPPLHHGGQRQPAPPPHHAGDQLPAGQSQPAWCRQCPAPAPPCPAVGRGPCQSRPGVPGAATSHRDAAAPIPARQRGLVPPQPHCPAPATGPGHARPRPHPGPG